MISVAFVVSTVSVIGLLVEDTMELDEYVDDDVDSSSIIVLGRNVEDTNIDVDCDGASVIAEEVAGSIVVCVTSAVFV